MSAAAWFTSMSSQFILLAQSSSITDRSVALPTWDQWRRLMFLQDYNTRVVILGATILGCAAGIVGGFTLLRKRALMGDALLHSMLPGIGTAFFVGTALGWDAKSLPLLLCGATLSGLLGVGTILAIRNLTRLKEDAAMGIVLSVYFGAGIAILGVTQQMRGGHAAGLESFIFGKTASMGAADAQFIAVAALGCIAVCVLLFKEFKLLCFDEGFAGSRGYPVVFLDLALMSTVILISIVGLQAVGLVLMIALLIVPAAAARFWTEVMWQMLAISALLGAVSALLGASASALAPKLPSGAMIVLVCAALFALSMVFGTARGVLGRTVRRIRLNRSVARQHVLRAIFEVQERKNESAPAVAAEGVALDELLEERSWSRSSLQRAIARAERSELVVNVSGSIALTKKGQLEAERLTREHRLWELYLIAYADIAPSRVDRQADRIEHVLEPEVVAELEAALDSRRTALPASPHQPTGSTAIADALSTKEQV